MEPQRAPRVYSYRRFSTPEQLQGDSLRRQTALAAAWASSRGLELDQELAYTDLGVSAYRGRNVDQGALGEFLRAIEDDLVKPGDVLLVESLDRLSRQTARRALRALEGIVDAGVTVVTLDTGREYTAETLDGDPMALIEIVLRATLAHDESVKKAARVKEAWVGKRRRLIEHGVALTAKGPSWLEMIDARWCVIPERAAIVKRIFELTAQGVGAETVAIRLNREKVPVFGRGRCWHKSFVMKVLSNPAVVGTMQPHVLAHDQQGRRRREPVGEPIEGYYPAVVEMELWETVQALRGGRRGPTSGPGKPAVSHLLAGLAVCGECGATMTKVIKSSRKRVRRTQLVCSRAKVGAGCQYRVVNIDVVERALIEGLDRAAAAAPGPDAGIAKEVELCEREIAGTEDALERVLEAVERSPSSGALLGRLSDLEATLSGLRERHGEVLRQSLLADRRGYLRRQQVAVEALKALAAGVLDVTKANAALRAAVLRVEVDYVDGQLNVHWLGDGVSSIVYAWPRAA